MLGRRTKVAAGVVAAMALAMALPMAAANAATQDLEFTNTDGSVTVGSLAPIAVPAGGAGLAGTWDDSTGEFTGTLQFNPINLVPPAAPLAVTVTLANNGAENVTGTIDPTTGVAALSASMILTIQIPSLSANCSTSAFTVTLVDDGDPLAPLPFDPTSSYTMGLDGTFTVPAFGQDCALGAAINIAVGLPAGGNLSLALERGTPVPPTTTPAPAPTTATTAAAAATTQPKFTG